MLAIRFVKMKDGNRIYRSYFFNRKSMLSLSLKGFIPLKFIICILKNDFEFEHTFPLKHKFELYCNLRGKNVED